MKKLALYIGLILISASGSASGQVDEDNYDFPWYNPAISFQDRIDLIIAEMTIPEKISQLMHNSPAIERLGIPAYNWWNEALHGVARSGRATVFPQPIGLGATFDKDLVYRVFNGVSDEARAKFEEAQRIGNRGRNAGLTFWTPNVNIFRDPRWGRGMETYGEDPYLTSQLGIACVKGLQGDHPVYLKSAACAKHYAVHSGPEAVRHEFDAISTMKDLHETYLPAFKELVTSARVESVMGAYNRVNGQPACASDMLLGEILMKEWGFKGYIVSDCGAIHDFYDGHNVSTTPAEAAALAINKGVTLNCGFTYAALSEAIDQGMVTVETIDERLSCLLTTRFRLGFFDPSSLNPFKAIQQSVIASENNRQLAYEAALKSIVLLKNKGGALPLDRNARSIYLTGPHASNNEVLLGNYNGVSENLVSILEGITAKVGVGTSILYRQGILDYQDNINPIDYVTPQARQTDIVIAVMGLSGLIEGEEGESLASPTKGDRIDLSLPKNQVDFLRKIKNGRDKNKPLIVVMTGGSPITMPEVMEMADAVLWVWYPGQEGGNAVADVIFGNEIPSGRLPITFPESVDQLPDYEDYSMLERTYRYMTSTPLFPFGFGLSYTTFEYGEIQFSREQISAGETVKVSVEVTNTGDYNGEEVVQLYVSVPDKNGDQPLWSLKAFDRIYLEKDASGEISFELGTDELQQFAQDGSACVKPGIYNIHVGGSSPGKRSKALGIDLQSVNFVVN